MTMPATVRVLDTATVIRCDEVAGAELAWKLVAEVKRVFAAAGAVAR